jgi:hypothetical protein
MAYRCRFEPSPNRSRQLAEAVNATGVKLAKLFSGLLQYGAILSAISSKRIMR